MATTAPALLLDEDVWLPAIGLVIPKAEYTTMVLQKSETLQVHLGDVVRAVIAGRLRDAAVCSISAPLAQKSAASVELLFADERTGGTRVRSMSPLVVRSMSTITGEAMRSTLKKALEEWYALPRNARRKAAAEQWQSMDADERKVFTLQSIQDELSALYPSRLLSTFGTITPEK
jgi:hypothetical protein